MALQGHSGPYSQYGHDRTTFWKTGNLFLAWFSESHSFIAITMSSCEVPLPEIDESPTQLVDFSFSSRKFGKSNVVSCAYTASRLARWKWLQYTMMLHNKTTMHKIDTDSAD